MDIFDPIYNGAIISACIYLLTFGAFAAVAIAEMRRQKRCKVQTEAKLVDFVEDGYISKYDDDSYKNTYPVQPDDIKHRFCAPLYEYKVNGKTAHFRGTWSNIQRAKIGDKMVIMVNPDDLSEYYELDKKKHPGTILAIVGATTFILVVILLLKMLLQL